MRAAGSCGGHGLVWSGWQGDLLPGDGLPSVQERYGATACQVRLIELAAQRLVGQRLLLEEDADRYVEQAMKRQYSSSKRPRSSSLPSIP